MNAIMLFTMLMKKSCFGLPGLLVGRKTSVFFLTNRYANVRHDLSPIIFVIRILLGWHQTLGQQVTVNMTIFFWPFNSADLDAWVVATCIKMNLGNYLNDDYNTFWVKTILDIIHGVNKF